MHRTPVFSIVTVTLNNLAGLKKTASSLECQTFRNFEWIVIDGGSEDDTPVWLAQSPARWISESDGGLFEAMNKGLPRALGLYVLFLNAGDTLAQPDTLEKTYAAIKHQTALPDLVYGDALVERRPAPLYKKARPAQSYRRGMFTHHQAMLYRREAAVSLSYDTRYRIAADYNLTRRFLQRFSNTLYCPFAFCLFESGGLSQRRAFQGRCEEFCIRMKLGDGLMRSLAIFMRQTLTWTIRGIFFAWL